MSIRLFCVYDQVRQLKNKAETEANIAKGIVVTESSGKGNRITLCRIAGILSPVFMSVLKTYKIVQ